MKIDELMVSEGSSIYYDETFLNVIEDHMTYLRLHPDTNSITIDSNIALKFKFDLNGALRYYNVPAQLHHVVMRMNNMQSPTDMNGEITSLLIPNTNTLEHIRTSHMTARRIK